MIKDPVYLVKMISFMTDWIHVELRNKKEGTNDIKSSTNSSSKMEA